MKTSTNKTETKKVAALGKVGVFALSLVAASTAVYLYSPVIRTHAEATADADFNVTVNEVLNLTLDKNTLSLNTGMFNFVQGTVNAVASTNSEYGYTLTLEDVDDNTDLNHTNSEITSTVSSGFDGKKTSEQMEDNTWGFSLNTTDFSKIPAYGSPVALRRVDTPMETLNETTSVDFGVKVGNLTAGTYVDTVLFSLYTNGQNVPVTPPMQDYDCDLMNVGEVSTVRDDRDGKTYRITKTNDDRCWMAQNLRFVGPYTLTPEDSNVSENWEMPAQPTGPDHEYWYATSSLDDSSYSVIEYKDSGDSQIGVHYNYYVTTAGTISGKENYDEATSSICPKGWKLPSYQEYVNMFDLEGIYHRGIPKPEKAVAAPYSFYLSGYYELIGTSIRSLGTDGFWWTTSVAPTSGGSNTPSEYRYTTDIGSSSIILNMPGDRRRGFTVRCVTVE